MGLAVLEAILDSGVVALRAVRTDAKVRLHTRFEFVMVDDSDGQCLLAACIRLLANSLCISKEATSSAAVTVLKILAMGAYLVCMRILVSSLYALEIFQLL